MKNDQWAVENVKTFEGYKALSDSMANRPDIAHELGCFMPLMNHTLMLVGFKYSIHYANGTATVTTY